MEKWPKNFSLINIPIDSTIENIITEEFNSFSKALKLTDDFLLNINKTVRKI